MGYVLRSLFIPAGKNGDKLSDIRAYYEEEYGDNIQYNAGTVFAAVGADDISDFDHYDLSKDSEIFGEAIGIQIMTYGDDFFLYDHWDNGKPVRILSYDPYKGWIRVEGREEAWEKECFFKAGTLEQDIFFLEQNPVITEKEQRISQLRHLIELGHLIEGYSYPVISGEGVFFDIIRHFNLTWPKI